MDQEERVARCGVLAQRRALRPEGCPHETKCGLQPAPTNTGCCDPGVLATGAGTAAARTLFHC